MNIQKINDAYGALKRLSEAPLPAQKAFDLYRTIKKIETARSFYVEKERDLITSYSGEVEPDGRIKFKDENITNDFLRKIKELYDVESELNVQPVILSGDELENLKISSSDIMKLEGFVEFKYDSGGE